MSDSDNEMCLDNDDTKGEEEIFEQAFEQKVQPLRAMKKRAAGGSRICNILRSKILLDTLVPLMDL